MSTELTQQFIKYMDFRPKINLDKFSEVVSVIDSNLDKSLREEFKKEYDIILNDIKKHKFRSRYLKGDTIDTVLEDLVKVNAKLEISKKQLAIIFMFVGQIFFEYFKADLQDKLKSRKLKSSNVKTPIYNLTIEYLTKISGKLEIEKAKRGTDVGNPGEKKLFALALNLKMKEGLRKYTYIDALKDANKTLKVYSVKYLVKNMQDIDRRFRQYRLREKKKT